METPANDLSRLTYDREALPPGGILFGVDEAGRGALAGPVVAAAVAARKAFFDSPLSTSLAPHVRDSKQLSEEERNRLRSELLKAQKAGLLSLGVGFGTVVEIAQENILGATRLAMRRALKKAAQLARCELLPQAPELPFPSSAKADHSSPEGSERPSSAVTGCPEGTDGPAPATFIKPVATRLLIDGRPLKPFPYAHEGLVKGDDRSFLIAAASILAKTERDALMMDLSHLHPVYGFSLHKGYGTPLHRRAIREHGPCPHHRELFLRKLQLGERR